ncbi:MAG: hypothetical protein RLO21_04250, partial [Nitratireductor sp.]
YVNGAKAINTEAGAWSTLISGGLIENCGHGLYSDGLIWRSAANPDYYRTFPASGISSIDAVSLISVTLPVGASSDPDAYVGQYAYFYETPGDTDKWTYRRKVISYDASSRGIWLEYALPSGAVTTAWGVAIGHPKRNSHNIFTDIRMVNCGSALTIRGGWQSSGDDPFDNMDIWSDMALENCGHAPLLIAGDSASIGHDKVGVINLIGASGAKVENVQIRNDEFFPEQFASDFPGYSPGYSGLSPYQIGEGLSGPTGAIIWGAATNSEFKNISYYGDCDAMIVVGKVDALSAPWTPLAAERWNIDGLYHYGTSKRVMMKGNQNGDNLNVPSAVSGRWENLHYGTLTEGWISGSGWSAYTGLYVELVNPLSQGKYVGTPQQLFNAGNNHVAFGASESVNYAPDGLSAKQFQSHTFTLADDTAISFSAPKSAGVVILSVDGGTGQDIFRYNTTGPTCERASAFATGSAVTNASTGVLTGTTSADGVVSLAPSATGGGRIYVENRLGGTVSFTLTFIA